MGFSTAKRGSGGFQPLAEINVTPLVDVMLVLLIIFMVTAPMMAAGMKVNLPQARNAKPKAAVVFPLPSPVCTTTSGRARRCRVVRPSSGATAGCPCGIYAALRASRTSAVTLSARNSSRATAVPPR